MTRKPDNSPLTLSELAKRKKSLALYRCSKCDQDFPTALKMGHHNYWVHGVKGKSYDAKKRWAQREALGRNGNRKSVPVANPSTEVEATPSVYPHFCPQCNYPLGALVRAMQLIAKVEKGIAHEG